MRRIQKSEKEYARRWKPTQRINTNLEYSDQERNSVNYIENKENNYALQFWW